MVNYMPLRTGVIDDEGDDISRYLNIIVQLYHHLGLPTSWTIGLIKWDQGSG